MSRALFSVGTSRGGTTLFARMLSNHPGVRVASDPFLPLFRSFRTTIARQTFAPAYDAAQPLEDYYFSPARYARMRAIQDASLNTPLPSGGLDALRGQLAARMDLAAKEVVPYLSMLGGQTYRDVLASGLDALATAYQATDAAWVGFNDNWIGEFLPLALRAFPDARGVILVRDPRAAMASSMKLRERKPEKAHLVPLMISFARHWRKHAAFAWMLARDPEFVGRVHVLRYEDLCTQPEQTLRSLCTFLGIDVHPAMLDTEHFRPLEGTRWTGHSNFDVPATGIYTESISAWKQYLSASSIESIECFCGPEMRLWGYEPVCAARGLPSSSVLRFLVDDSALATGWRGNHDAWDVELGHELLRQHMLQWDASLLSTPTVVQHFLFERVFHACRALSPAPV